MFKSPTVAVGTGALGVGSFVGVRKARDQEEVEGVSGQGLGVAHGLATGVALGATTAGVVALRQPIGGILGPATKRTGSYLAGSYSKAFQEQTVKGIAGHMPVTMGVGAGLGALAGSQISDDPGKGAAIGAGVGAAAGAAVPAVMRGTSAWKSLGKHVPGGQTAALLLASVAVAGGARLATHQPEYSQEDTAVSDNQGGYVPQNGPRERALSMGATGDMVLGLHRRRHG